MGFLRKALLLCAVAAAASATADYRPYMGPYSGNRYATDAYPGFDESSDTIRPEKKTPRWFSWITGPKMGDAASQFEWAAKCEAEGSVNKAIREYDALVRNWPTSPEAPKAQRALADLMLKKGGGSLEDAFAEYKYLLDFYSLQCDSGAVADIMYAVAGLMREEGKTVLFIRFANRTDVRRAYEATVLRAPGAAFVPQAFLAIASLREEDGEMDEAVKVYENLRSRYPSSAAAEAALYRECRARMNVLRDFGYNAARSADTRSFLQMALKGPLAGQEAEDVAEWLAEAEAMAEDELFKSASFYDSRMRTRRSAINAYRRYLAHHPSGERADAARRRLEALLGEERVKDEDR